MGGQAGNPTGADLSGNATITYLGIKGKGSKAKMKFGLTINNTSGPGAGGIGLTALGFGASFGFDQDPNIAVDSWKAKKNISRDETKGGKKVKSKSKLGSVKTIDPTDAGSAMPDLINIGGGSRNGECANANDPKTAKDDGCVVLVAVTSANSDGVLSGETDTFEFTLDLSQITDPTLPLTLNPFAVAYGAGSEANAAPAAARQLAVSRLAAQPVPLPGTLGLLVVGLLAARRFSTGG